MPFSYFPRFGSRVRPLLALLAFCVSLSAQVMPAARRGDGASLPLMPWPAEVQVQTGELPITQKFTLALRGEGAGDPRVVESARLASDLAPLRYVGVQLGGSILSNSVSYEAGYFDGSEDGSNGNFQWTQSHELAVRGFFLPFAKTGVKAAHQFGVGLAGSLGDQVGSIAGLKTVGQTTFFKFTSTAMANGRHDRVSPQAYYYFGPVGLISEYVISTQEVLNNSARRRLRNQAWQAAGSVMLTGEKNGYGGIRPRNSFDPSKGFRSLGAVELAARYSQLQIDPGAFPIFANPATAGREGQEYGIGANWYLNRFVKLVIDYEQTSFKMATGNSTPLHSEKVWMSRIQLAF